MGMWFRFDLIFRTEHQIRSGSIYYKKLKFNLLFKNIETLIYPLFLFIIHNNECMTNREYIDDFSFRLLNINGNKLMFFTLFKLN